MNQFAREWLYFGCHREPGHYLFTRGMRPLYFNRHLEKLNRLDQMLAPQDTRDGYIAVITSLGGWGFTALSFWDYSVDSRPGSNSTFFAPRAEMGVEELMRGSIEAFPEVWTRLPQVKVRKESGLLLIRNRETGIWTVDGASDEN
ncbi:MAG TPA: hypothetical protein VEC35_01240 [Noviherbaspirillum sp.]|nr:hypothetical protein [Noviherbaspirillum sp.]